MNKEQQAVNNFLEGYNCAQAVLLAFSDELGLDKKQSAMLSSSFGGGMGKLREVCGAVSAMFMVAGYKCGYFDPKDLNAKKEHYALIQKLAEKFKDAHGCIVCRELLASIKTNGLNIPENRTEEYYKTRPCAMFVGTAAKITNEELF